MSRRLGFRHLLPVLLLLIQLTIFFCDWVHAGHGLIVPPEPEMAWNVGRRIPVAIKAAAVFNLPALEMALPVGIAFPTMSNTGAILVSIPFVPLLWYGIGLWLDRLTGRAAPSRRQYPKLRAIGKTAAVTLLFLTVVSMTPLNHHREPDRYWTGGITIIWSMLLFAICAKRPTQKENA